MSLRAAPLLTVTATLTLASRALAGEVSDAVASGAEERTTELGDARFATPAALCRAYVAWAKEVRATSRPHHDESIVPHAARCTAAEQSLPFAGDATWRSLRTLHVDDGIGSASRLIVQTPQGWLLTPMSWNERDPRDPGCPSIVRDVNVDGAGIQNGRLVVIMAGERTAQVEPTSDDDPAIRAELVRTPYWATATGGKVAFMSTQSMISGGALGTKLQPNGPGKRWVAWSDLKWSGLRSFHVAADGSVRVSPDP